MRELARGDKPYLGKSIDRKAQIRPAFVQRTDFIISKENMQLSGRISQVRLGNSAAASKFCRLVKQQQEKGCACVSVLCLSRLFNLVYLSTCSSIFACFEIDNNLVLVGLFDRCPRIERPRTSQHYVKSACSSDVFARSSNEMKNQSESHEA